MYAHMWPVLNRGEVSHLFIKHVLLYFILLMTHCSVQSELHILCMWTWKIYSSSPRTTTTPSPMIHQLHTNSTACLLEITFYICMVYLHYAQPSFTSFYIINNFWSKMMKRSVLLCPFEDDLQSLFSISQAQSDSNCDTSERVTYAW